MILKNVGYADDHNGDIPKMMQQRTDQLQGAPWEVHSRSSPDGCVTVYPAEATPGMLISALATLPGI